MRQHHQGGIGSAFGSAAGLLALSLIVLGAGLASVQQRVNTLRAQIYEIAEPTIELTFELQYLLARQTSSLRGYLISRDTTYLERYDSFYALERDIYPRMARLAAELTPEIAAQVGELMMLSAGWHARLAIEEITAAGLAGAPVDAPVVLLEQELYVGTLETAAATAEAIRGFVRDRQEDIQRVERTARLILAFLVVAAGVVAVSIYALSTRVRRLAAEAERRRRETAEAMDRTEQAVADREYLIRGFTHDVKNPLHVADGYAHLLELGFRGELPEPQGEVVGRIRSAIRGAVTIIDDLLDISRMEGEGLQVKRETVDVCLLTEQVVEDHAGAAERAGVELRFRGPSAGIEAVTDADRVRQVIKNLISNALKYTPSPGRISVRIETSVDGDGHVGSWTRVLVEDTGPGIALEEQERIFWEFHRVPGSAAAGHGLGLAISRRLARICGGDLTVESLPGQGATFTLWLPPPTDGDPAMPSPSRSHRESHARSG